MNSHMYQTLTKLFAAEITITFVWLFSFFFLNNATGDGCYDTLLA